MVRKRRGGGGGGGSGAATPLHRRRGRGSFGIHHSGSGVGVILDGAADADADGVGSDPPMPYETYKSHLETLCSQLDVRPRPRFEDLVLLPGDDDDARLAKSRRLAQNARQDLCNLLGNRRVLVILDDVWHPRDVELFSFGNRSTSKCRNLVTTRMRPPWDDVRTVDLGTLNEEEAIDLLLRESGRRGAASSSSSGPPRDIIDAEERGEARRIVTGCGRLPVAVRAAGRLLSTLSANGDEMSLKDLADSISRRDVEGDDGNGDGAVLDSTSALFEMLDRSFATAMHGEVGSKVMKRFFASFATAFSRDDCLRPWIPARSIHVLWDGLLTDEEQSELEAGDPPTTTTTTGGRRRSATVRALEAMESLGVLDRRSVRTEEDSRARFSYRIHHDTMHQYAARALLLGNVEEVLFSGRRLPRQQRGRRKGTPKGGGGRRRVGPVTKKLFKGGLASSREKLAARIHERFVESCFGSSNPKVGRDWTTGAGDDEYVYRYLPTHMAKAGLDQTAEDVLSDGSFVRCRLRCVGVEGGTEAHVADVERLRRLVDRRGKKRRSSGAKSQSAVAERKKLLTERSFDALSCRLRELLAEDSRNAEEVGRAFLAIGTALQRMSQWYEALSVLAEALDSYRHRNRDDDIDVDRDDEGPVVERIRERIRASSLPKVAFLDRNSTNRIRFKHAEALRAMASSNRDGRRGEPVALELSSHPGLGVVLLHSQFDHFGPFHVLELGIGPEESAVDVVWDGERYVRAGDGAVICSNSHYKEGDGICLATKKTMDNRLIGGFFGSNLVINDDGGMSPKTKPNLAMGFGYPELMLVERDSPSRIILRHADDLRRNVLPTVGYDPTTDETKIFATELSSHPDRALVKIQKSCMKFGPVSVFLVGCGPKENALRLSYDGRILADADTGFVLKIRLSQYRIGSNVTLQKDRSKSNTLWEGGGSDFVINEDGSVSPAHSPNFAIGVQSLGIANELLSAEQKEDARREAKRPSSRLPMRVMVKESLTALKTVLLFRSSDGRDA